MNENPGQLARSAVEVRQWLVEALGEDLVGPGWRGEEERLRGHERPLNWYLMGFLAPVGAEVQEGGEESEEAEAAEEGGVDEGQVERQAARRTYFPSSMGISFLVPAGVGSVVVEASWGDYRRVAAGAGEEVGEGEGAEDVVEGAGAVREGGAVVDGAIVGGATAGGEEGAGAVTAEGGADGAAGAAIAAGRSQRRREVWQRVPGVRRVEVELRVGAPLRVVLEGTGGLVLEGLVRELPERAASRGLPAGTRSVSLFLVNRRAAREPSDEAFAFQVQLEVLSEAGFVGRPDLRETSGGDSDEKLADLHYADAPEFATGHGVSATWELEGGRCRRIRTAWLPEAQVLKTETVELAGVELSIETLGQVADGAALRRALGGMVSAYRGWIQGQRVLMERLAGDRRDTALNLVADAELAAGRIEQGLLALERDGLALDAFKVANRAVARAMRQRRRAQGLPEMEPRWRAFQLAFLLLNLRGLVEPEHMERRWVELLFFPTGGGKTEAYLGLAAFAMVLRRLRATAEEPARAAAGEGARAAGAGGAAPAIGLEGGGVAVLMRYTLRLLTLDQLGRAAGLVCALELERLAAPERYGTWPFEIGLWVGKAATPNLMGRKGDKNSDSARAKVRRFKDSPQSNPLPIPLDACPWCGTGFTPSSFTLAPNENEPQELRVVCTNPRCDFTRDRALPLVAVDESIYRRLPAFVIATVDKFASLPWVGPSGALLGGADRADRQGFYGAADPGLGRALRRPLGPPDLIIQDELHLISGPLGTMAGLYETAIEALCLGATPGARPPKIVASTATARQARSQIQALFGRDSTRIFPPPGVDRRDSFFARTRPAEEVAARRYVGLAASGRNPKVILRRVYLALMAAAERCFRDAGGHRQVDNPADAYMTVLGYFNSLKELGGARRILEEEVQHSLQHYGRRRRLGEADSRFQSRSNLNEVVELTSRVATHEVAQARQRLETPFWVGTGAAAGAAEPASAGGAGRAAERRRVDFAIATNMISVGLDIPRLGLMVVFGQPKTHAEYIQATSRVGRDDRRPGLVVTLLNIHKPRDRSHYERFRHYHETFYRSVEAASVTPFSARALDRGFAGALVALARQGSRALTPARGVAELRERRQEVEQRLLKAFRDRLARQDMVPEEQEQRRRSIAERISDLLDAWQRVVTELAGAGAEVQYQKYELQRGAALLRDQLEGDFVIPDQRKFRLHRSMREVEPVVPLYFKRHNGQDLEID